MSHLFYYSLYLIFLTIYYRNLFSISFSVNCFYLSLSLGSTRPRSLSFSVEAASDMADLRPVLGVPLIFDLVPLSLYATLFLEPVDIDSSSVGLASTCDEAPASFDCARSARSATCDTVVLILDSQLEITGLLAGETRISPALFRSRSRWNAFAMRAHSISSAVASRNTGESHMVGSLSVCY